VLVCDRASTSTVNGVQLEILPVAENPFPTWGASLFKECCSVILQNHSSTAWCMLLYSWCTQCMENNDLSRACVDLFLWRQKQESNRCSITGEDQPRHLFSAAVLRTFSVFQLKVMKSLGALTACLAWAGMPLECPQCPPYPAANLV